MALSFTDFNKILDLVTEIQKIAPVDTSSIHGWLSMNAPEDNKKYAVYDCGKPAKFPFYNVDPSWNNNIFDTFEEAKAYAENWLGTFFHVAISLNKPVEYYKDCTIEVKEIEIEEDDN
ncbi:MAG: hypothetical protein ACOC5T_05005 [Elusimicrobiota bacterium]